MSFIRDKDKYVFENNKNLIFFIYEKENSFNRLSIMTNQTIINTMTPRLDPILHKLHKYLKLKVTPILIKLEKNQKMKKICLKRIET